MSNKQMLIQDNLVLTRSDPSGMGGTQLIYRIKNYGLTAVSYTHLTLPTSDLV